MHNLLSHKGAQTFVLIVLLFTVVFFNFSNMRWRHQIRNVTFDYYNILKPFEPEENVVIIDIDEASLGHKDLGQWPWARTKLAALVDELDKLGASAIVFDMVFSEPDRTSPQHIMEVFEKEDKERFQQVQDILEQLPDNDEIFAEAIKNAGNVVTGFSFTSELTRTSPRQKAFVRGKHIDKYVRNLEGVAANVKIISKAAAGNGSFFVSSDTDGIIRRVPMLVAHRKHGGEITTIYPSLALEGFRVSRSAKTIHVKLLDEKYAKLDKARYGIEGIRFNKSGKLIPTNTKGEFLVYFAKPNKKWYLPAYKILDRTIEPSKVKGKIALIGTSAVGLKDSRATPLDSFRPGVEVHLNIINQIIQKQFLYRSVEAEGKEAVAIIIAGLIIILLTPYIGAISQSILVLTILIMGFAAGWYSFAENGQLIDVLYPAIAIAIIFTASSLLTYMRLERERQQVRQAFGLYVSPDLMDELTKDPDKLKLGGEIKELTTMFTDIRDFTTISECMTPEELIQLMNDFLTPMSDLVMANRGTIDKYMGDAMMAFWNAPLNDENHARNACETILQMHDALAPINEKLANKEYYSGDKPLILQAGIGVNTGQASVGNMGSKQRFAYSALGDSVNLASRLEAQTKNYGVNNLIGENTQQKVTDLAILEIDFIQVKGKTEPVKIYTLLGNEKFANDTSFKEWQTTHNEMIKQYRSSNFKDASNLIKQCQTKSDNQLSDLYKLYQQRITIYTKTPPAKDWGGVYVATSK